MYRYPTDLYFYTNPKPQEKPIINNDDLHDALDNEDYPKIYKILDLVNTYWGQPDKFNVIPRLFDYSFKNNDIELLKKLVEKNKDIDLFERRCNSVYIVMANKDMLDICFKMDCFKIQNVCGLLDQALIRNNMDIVLRLGKLGHKMTKQNIYNGICSNNIEIIKYITTDYEDLQSVCDMLYNNTYCACNFNTVKYLVNIGINIDNYLNNMILSGLYHGYDDLVMYCYDIGVTNTYEILERCILFNRHESLTYFINKGINLTLLKKENFKFVKYEIVKILFDSEYIFSEELLGHILKNSFIHGDIENVKSIFTYVSNFDCIFERESYYTNNKPTINEYDNIADNIGMECENFDTEYIFSILEYIIHQGKLDHLKFIVNNSNNILDINKLFIVAINNNQVDIAHYLMDINSDVDYKLAVECACYFGHYDAFNFLLKYCDDYDKNLFDICINGMYGDNDNNRFYNKLVNKINILNDIVGSGDDYAKIMLVLLDMNLIMDINIFYKIGPEYYNTKIIDYMLDAGHDKNELLKFFAIKECNDRYCNFNEPKMLIMIVTHLLDNGANPNVENVKNDDIKQLLTKYGCELYL